MIVLRTPKGWTGPKVVDGMPVRGHLARPPGAAAATATTPEHRADARELDAQLPARGALRRRRPARPRARGAGARRATRRMSANPHANGGLLLRDLRLPDFRDYAVDVPQPGAPRPRPRACWAVPARRHDGSTRSTNFRLVRPGRDGLEPARRTCSRSPTAPGWPSICPRTTTIWRRTAGSWRCCSEHLCQGWLEGYLLTGRHGLFNCYEAFIHIVDSMFNQHAKWLKVTRRHPWRRPIASLNYLLSSHVWRQDHNGFSHQDPGSSTTS